MAITIPSTSGVSAAYAGMTIVGTATTATQSANTIATDWQTVKVQEANQGAQLAGEVHPPPVNGH